MSLNSPVDQALYDHLVRLLIAGGLSVVLGLGVAMFRPSLRAFGLMNAAWGAVDGAIAILGLREPHVEKIEPFMKFLSLNIGLNCGYIAVGITMVAFAGDRRPIKGSGAAVVLQGAILLVLDGYLANTIPT